MVTVWPKLIGILNMLIGQNDVPKEDENIRKIDNTDENSEISTEKKDTISVIQKDENVTLKMEVESSEESDSQENVQKDIDAKKSEKDKIVKQVTFVETAVTEHSACIDTMAQLDDTFILDEEGNSPPVMDTGQDAKTH